MRWISLCLEAHARRPPSSAPAAAISRKLRRLIRVPPYDPVPAGQSSGPRFPITSYFTTNIEVGAEVVLVVETNVKAPLAGVILNPEIVPEV